MTNKVGGVIQGSTAIQGFGVGVVVNSGLINGIVGGGGQGINFAGNNTSTVTVTNKASGTITGDAFAINASGATVTNFGTISAPKFGGVAVNANTLTLVNKASGVIKGNGGAISGSQTPVLTITNLGKITSGANSFATISGNVVDVTNSGTISIAANAGGSAISTESGDIVNKTGGVIRGELRHHRGDRQHQRVQRRDDFGHRRATRFSSPRRAAAAAATRSLSRPAA